MKFLKKTLSYLIFFATIFFLFPLKVSAAPCPYPECAYDPNTIETVCNKSACADCCFCFPEGCGGYSPTVEPSENISGKVYNPALPDSLSTLTGSSFLKKLLNTGISLIFVGGSVIFFFLLLSGGIRWVTGGGDKGKLEGAQKQITHALVGLAILLSSFAIIQLIDTIFGISLSNISLPTL